MEGPSDGHRFADAGDPDRADGEPDDHWVVTLLGSVATYLMLASVGTSLLGLAGLAVDLQPFANVLLTLGILGGTASMGLAMVVHSLSNTPFSWADGDVDHL